MILADDGGFSTSLKDKIAKAWEYCFTSDTVVDGPFVRKLELATLEWSGLAEYRAVGTNSTLSAMIACLKACDVNKGSNVMLAGFGNGVAAAAVSSIGANPIFCDVDSSTWLMTAEKVKICADKHVTHPKDIKCIIATHMFGSLAPMRQIKKYCDYFNIALVEDCCEVLGTLDSEGKGAGWNGDAAVFNLGPSGMIVTKYPHIEDRCRKLIDPRVQPEEGNHFAVEGRMGETIAAALGYHLDEFYSFVDRRAALVQYFRSCLSYTTYSSATPTSGFPSYVEFCVKVPNWTSSEEIRDRLVEKGIGSRIAYNPSLKKFFNGGVEYETPVADKLSERCLAFPITTTMTTSDVDTIVACLREALKEVRGE